jgi:adenylate cyclase
MLAPLGPVELRTLQRIAASPNVRLACQLRPSVDVSVVPLVPAGPDLGSGALRFDAGVEGGRELPIAAMFVDMRGSTRLATGRLPYLTAVQFDTDGSAEDEKKHRCLRLDTP